MKEWVRQRWTRKREADPAGSLALKRLRVGPIVSGIRGNMPFELQATSPLATAGPDGGEVTVIAMQDRYGFPIRLAMCHETGLLFLMDRLTPEGYDSFYRDGTYRQLVAGFHGMSNESGAILDAQEKQASANAEIVVRALQGRLHLPAASRVLDVGGSTGALARSLRANYGAKVTVVDPAAAELRVARESGFETKLGTIEQVEFAAGEQYELVIVNQAMEHIIDLRGAMSRIHGLLAPGGILVFDILDFMVLTEILGCAEAASRLDHCHFYYDEMIDVFCRRLGFSVRDRVFHQPGCVLYVCTKATPVPAARVSDNVTAVIRRKLLSHDVAWKMRGLSARQSLEERVMRRMARSARSFRAALRGSRG